MAGGASERRHHERRQVSKQITQARRRDTDRRRRRLDYAAGTAEASFEVRRRRLRVLVLEARRAIEASREALKKKKR